MKRLVVSIAAAATLFAGIAGGVSAAGDNAQAPYDKVCVGIINSYQAAELGITPRDSADQYFNGSVQDYQAMQRTCKGPGHG